MIDRRNKNINLKTMSFTDMVHFLSFEKYLIDEDLNTNTYLFIVEAGWLNKKSNFHGQRGARAERIAKNVGANHQTGKHIIEICKYFGFDVVEQSPLKKCWRGRDGKITHDELMELIKKTGYKFKINRTNQEERDAALLAMVTAKLV